MREGAFHLAGNLATIENRSLFQAQFEYLLECAHRNPSTYSVNLARHAIGLIAHFMQDPSDPKRDNIFKLKDEAVRVAVEYIWNFSHHNLDVAMVAGQAGIARRTLEQRFRAATGRSVLEEIQLCRLTRASRLLQETEMRIKNIVYCAGFRSEEHMRIAFHKAFGMSPQALRSENLQHKPAMGTAGVKPNQVRGEKI